MVLFALIVVVILGTIGLVIELGTVQLTRGRMQSAADSTALEVLRERDFDPAGFGALDQHARDHSRRERNRGIASWTFAAELQETYPDSEQGAGAYIEMHNGSSGPATNYMNSGLVVDEVGHSIPNLKTNYSGAPGSGAPLNKGNGDIVSGHFTGHEPGAPNGYDGNPVHRENGDYARVDFEVPAVADAPVSDSVLVRLRRTIPHGQVHPSGWNLDLDLEEDVSSSGWTRPLVFAMGSTSLGEDPADEYSIRHHGLRMRATSIAQARPAVRIGKGDPGPDSVWKIGAGPVAIRLAFWNNDTAFQIDEDGEISADLRLRPNYELESLEDDDFLFGYLYPKQPGQVGDEVIPDALQPTGGPTDENLSPSYWSVEECYVPLYFFKVGPPPESVRERFICGFGRIRIVEIFPAGELTDDGPFMRVTKLRNEMSPGKPWIAPRNASAVFDGSQPSVVFPVTGGATWDDLIKKLLTLPGPGEPPPYLRDSRVYAPAHVR